LRGIPLQFSPEDGCAPQAGVTLDKTGNVYGTTFQCGTFDWGTVFKIAPDNSETLLHSFNNDGTDGYGPQAGVLVLDNAGNIYGTTPMGGAGGWGTVFEFTPSGTETILHTFISDGVDGNQPFGGVTFGDVNTLYGTTIGGGASGANNYGTVYKVVP